MKWDICVGFSYRLWPAVLGLRRSHKQPTSCPHKTASALINSTQSMSPMGKMLFQTEESFQTGFTVLASIKKCGKCKADSAFNKKPQLWDKTTSLEFWSRIFHEDEDHVKALAWAVLMLAHVRQSWVLALKWLLFHEEWHICDRNTPCKQRAERDIQWTYWNHSAIWLAWPPCRHVWHHVNQFDTRLSLTESSPPGSAKKTSAYHLQVEHNKTDVMTSDILNHNSNILEWTLWWIKVRGE